VSALVELRGITKSVGAARALADVDFEVHAGEVVAVVGDNGASKSTLVKILAGTLPADAGEVRVGGQRLHLRSPNDAAALGISTVYQDLAICDALDVVANLFLGKERVHFSGLLDEETMERRAVDLLATLQVELPSVRVPIGRLSGGQRQSVAVARAILDEAKVVVMDEPTAALSVAQTRQVLDLVLRLRKHGLGVVIISHSLADLFEVADRIVVLRLGQIAGNLVTHDTTREEVVARITGARAADAHTQGARADKVKSSP
jgi:D-xylose transport system ATP-binding protein